MRQFDAAQLPRSLPDVDAAAVKQFIAEKFNEAYIAAW
jgi:ABC-type metal ion transport system substrate-binding protein